MRYVVVAAPPEVSAPADLGRLPAAADLVELRLDLLPQGAERARAWAGALGEGQGALLTLRSRDEGGAGAPPPAEAARLLGAVPGAWVDAEAPVLAALAASPPAADNGGLDVVLSRHGAFEAPALPAGLPSALRVRVLERAARIADAAGLERYLEALREPPGAGPGRAVMPTGPLAALRVLDPAAALLYGSAGRPVVEGQPPLLALLDELRAGEVTPRARLFGLLGAPPAASPSPALHNAAFRALGLDAVHVPLPGLSLARALALPFAGYSVTSPFKEAALAAADEASPAARAVGAANTLRALPGGGWEAHNTDVEALRVALAPVEAGRTVVVVGGGGYARAALAAARDLGLSARLVVREPARAAGLARAFAVPLAGLPWRREPGDGALVNATPAGADGREAPGLAGGLGGLHVLDAPYGEPGRVPWLTARARAEGAARTVDGLALLLGQAAGQVRAFTGADLDPGVLRLALRPATNLVLVGLRGAGKTTVGRALARRLGRPFVDLDAEVVRREGEALARLLHAGPGPGAGWEPLRRAERRALEALASRRGLVVATGGGAVEHEGAVGRLRALGLCAWLTVSPEEAARRVAADPVGRPPLGADASPLAEATRLLAQRAPRYDAAAHLRVDASGSVEAVVDALARAWSAHADLLERGASAPVGGR